MQIGKNGSPFDDLNAKLKALAEMSGDAKKIDTEAEKTLAKSLFEKAKGDLTGNEQTKILTGWGIEPNPENGKGVNVNVSIDVDGNNNNVTNTTVVGDGNVVGNNVSGNGKINTGDTNVNVGGDLNIGSGSNVNIGNNNDIYDNGDVNGAAQHGANESTRANDKTGNVAPKPKRPVDKSDRKTYNPGIDKPEKTDDKRGHDSGNVDKKNIAGNSKDIINGSDGEHGKTAPYRTGKPNPHTGEIPKETRKKYDFEVWVNRMPSPRPDLRNDNSDIFFYLEKNIKNTDDLNKIKAELLKCKSFEEKKALLKSYGIDLQIAY